jgi:hypothetical protein
MFGLVDLHTITFDDLNFDAAVEYFEKGDKFISRDIKSKFSKLNIGLGILFTNNCLSVDFLEHNPTYELVTKYFELYAESRGPSKLSKFEVLNDCLEYFHDMSEFSEIMHYDIYAKRRSLVKDYLHTESKKFHTQVTKIPLDSQPISQPDFFTVITMNVLNPQFTGYFFEYLLAYKLSPVTFIETSLNLDVVPIYSPEVLRGLYSRLARDGFDVNTVKTKDLYYPIVTDFNTIYDFIAYVVILHFNEITVERNSDFNESLLQVIELIKTPNYITKLNVWCEHYISNPMIKKWNAHKQLEHGYTIDENNEYNVRGEIDFINPNTVIDIKCSKRTPLKQYFYQLIYYSKLQTKFDKVINNLVILNLLTNECYTLDISKPVKTKEKLEQKRATQEIETRYAYPDKILVDVAEESLKTTIINDNY